MRLSVGNVRLSVVLRRNMTARVFQRGGREGGRAGSNG